MADLAIYSTSAESSDEFRRALAVQLAGFLRNRRGHEVAVNVDMPFNPTDSAGHAVRSNHRVIVVENRHTRRFGCIDIADYVAPKHTASRTHVQSDLCDVCLKCQYRENFYEANDYLKKIRPYFYFPKFPAIVESNADYFRRLPRTENALYWRGWRPNSRRPILARLEGLVSPSPDKVSFLQYAHELCAHKLALSLPGHANCNHRELEAFGMGTPVLMPRLKNTYHEPLVPDVHYLSVECDTVKDPPKTCAEALRERYHQVIGNEELLAYVRDNAVRWYDDHLRFCRLVPLTASLLGYG